MHRDGAEEGFVHQVHLHKFGAACSRDAGLTQEMIQPFADHHHPLVVVGQHAQVKLMHSDTRLWGMGQQGVQAAVVINVAVRDEDGVNIGRRDRHPKLVANDVEAVQQVADAAGVAGAGVEQGDHAVRQHQVDPGVEVGEGLDGDTINLGAVGGKVEFDRLRWFHKSV